MKAAILRAEELVEEIPGAVMARQFANPANPLVHEMTTGPEIWKDTGGKVDVLLAGVGTGGTLTGCARFLRKKNPSLHVVAVEPEASPILSGGPPGPHKIQGIGAGFVPQVLDQEIIDEVVTIKDDTALDTSRVLAKAEGIAGGISTGANVAAGMIIAAREEFAGSNIVTFAPSSADRYLSTPLFLDDDLDGEKS